MRRQQGASAIYCCSVQGAAAADKLFVTLLLERPRDQLSPCCALNSPSMLCSTEYPVTPPTYATVQNISPFLEKQRQPFFFLPLYVVKGSSGCSGQTQYIMLITARYGKHNVWLGMCVCGNYKYHFLNGEEENSFM